MRFAVPFLIVCAALVAAVLVLGAFARPPVTGPLPDLTLRDPSGRSFDLISMRSRIWVASFVGAGCLADCEATVRRLARLHDGLPDDVPLVTFVLGNPAQWPRRPAAADTRRDWIICQGNDVDADGESEVRRMASESLGVSEADLSALRSERSDVGGPGAIVVAMDELGRPMGVYEIDEADAGETDAPVAGAWGDVEFRVTLHRHAARDAWLHGIVLLLLIAGVILAWRGMVQIHPVCMGLAGAITLVLLASGFGYADFAASVPSRGSGWARPLYFSVLVAHTVLTGLIVILALTAIYHAIRRQFVRHTAMTRWLAPAWIAVALAGALVYGLLATWFPGS
jgi:putative membrane protein